MRALTLAFSLGLGVSSVVLPTPPARAFHGQADFRKRGIEGGGDGSYFTGSPRSRGYDCTVCHIDAPRRIFLTVDTSPPGPVTEGTYAPDQSYAVTVTMQGEHRGIGAPLNANTFVAEVTDAERAQAGIFTNLGATVERSASEELVIARGEHDNQTSWTFDWVAPPPGRGTLTLWLAAVDGDGAEGRLGRTGDPFGDDVFAAELRMAEIGAPPSQEHLEAASCSAWTPAPGLAPPVLLALAALAIRRRGAVSRTRRGGRGCPDRFPGRRCSAARRR